MNPRTHRGALCLALSLTLAGCSGNAIYRSDYGTCTYTGPGSCAAGALQLSAANQPGEYRLGFVEYDDQGQLRDRGQMAAVLEEFYRLASTEDVLLIAFVHGWHHSAKPGDENIEGFRNMLTEVSRLEELGSRQQNRDRRKILGVYVGWRGESITIPYLNNVTFWDRKNTAHDVGQQGVTELLLKLEEIVNVKLGMEEEVPPPVNSRLVVIGHSFGGAVVYTALQKVLADRFIDSRRGKTVRDDAKGFGDLVVLLNPAFEALRFGTLYDLSQEGCRRYTATQLPKLAILTSEADYATKYAFPAGRLFSTVFESHLSLSRHYCSAAGSQGMRPMQVDEGPADRNTVGHFEPYLTHRLDPAAGSLDRGADFRVGDMQTAWAQQSHGGSLDFAASRLVSLGRSTPLNPYLNVRVDKALIADHNDIWRPEIVAFIRDLIAISTTPTVKAP